MNKILGIDYAWQHPNPAAIKAAGYQFVIRYLSHDPSKDITASEIQQLHRAGLFVAGPVFEIGSHDVEGGKTAGIKYRQETENRSEKLGFPPEVTRFYACDEAISLPKAGPYYTGIHSGNRFPVGAYGDDEIVDGLINNNRLWTGWQTAAWSQGIVSHEASLYQRISKTLKPIAGTPSNSYDENILLKPMYMLGPNGLVLVGGSGQLPRTHNPFKPPSIPFNLGQPNADKNGVKYFQWALGCVTDGVPGPVTWKALTNFKTSHHTQPNHPDLIVRYQVYKLLSEITRPA